MKKEICTASHFPCSVRLDCRSASARLRAFCSSWEGSSSSSLQPTTLACKHRSISVIVMGGATPVEKREIGLLLSNARAGRRGSNRKGVDRDMRLTGFVAGAVGNGPGIEWGVFRFGFTPRPSPGRAAQEADIHRPWLLQKPKRSARSVRRSTGCSASLWWWRALASREWRRHGEGREERVSRDLDRSRACADARFGAGVRRRGAATGSLSRVH